MLFPGLEEVNSRVEMMASNITELKKALPSMLKYNEQLMVFLSLLCGTVRGVHERFSYMRPRLSSKYDGIEPVTYDARANGLNYYSHLILEALQHGRKKKNAAFSLLIRCMQAVIEIPCP